MYRHPGDRDDPKQQGLMLFNAGGKRGHVVGSDPNEKELKGQQVDGMRRDMSLGTDVPLDHSRRESSGTFVLLS